MKYIAVVLLFLSISPLLGQTKVWEATSPTTIDYIAISQDGSILATLSQKTLSVWRTDSSSAVKKINIAPTSNPVISNNNDTIYCLGRENGNHCLYAVPINKDTIYIRPLIELPKVHITSSSQHVVDDLHRYLYATIDSNLLIYGYSYTLNFADPSTYKVGMFGSLNTVGHQISNYFNEAVFLSDFNYFNNRLFTTGTSTYAFYRFDKRYQSYSLITSVNTNQKVYEKTGYLNKIEYSSIGVCRDTNYFIANEKMFHIPSGDLIHSFNSSFVGRYHSCSSNRDFYLAIKDLSINFVSYNSDTASLFIKYTGKLKHCKLSSNSNRVVTVTNDTIIAVYDIPEIFENEVLHADFSSDYKKPFRGGVLQFRNNSHIPEATYTLLWDFGDGKTSADLHPTHCYKQPGLYSVSLSVTTKSGKKDVLVKTNYIDYQELVKPQEALWSKKYSNGRITALSYITDDSLFAGTNDGSIFSITSNGMLGSYILQYKQMEFRFTYSSQHSHTELLHIRAFTYLEKTNELYSIVVPKGISAFAYLLKYSLKDPSEIKIIELGIPSYDWVNLPDGTQFYEEKDGGYASLDVSVDSNYIHYSNYGFARYFYENYYRDSFFSGESKGNYIGTLNNRTESNIYDNGMSRYFANSNDPSYINSKFLSGAFSLRNLNVYSIRGGRPYNPNSYFVIANNNVHHIRYNTFDLIAKYPTKGTILRHSPDQYHSFTSDGVWSFADGKRLDSLPLLTARSFEVFPDGVNLLVMYPKSDTVALFNTRTKQYVQYFKANFIVSSIAISKDGKSFATGDTGGIVTLWQTPKLNITKKIEFISPRADKSHIKGDTVQFFNTSIPVNSGCRYVWDFGDGTSSQDLMPKHIYEKAGKYTVGLRAYCPPESGIDSTVDHLEKLEYITITDSATSVEIREVIPQEHLTINPNPLTNHGVINVNFPHTEHFSVRISTLLGQEIMIATDVQSAHEHYSIPILPSGVYSCQLRMWNGEIISRPFIVSK